MSSLSAFSGDGRSMPGPPPRGQLEPLGEAEFFADHWQVGNIITRTSRYGSITMSGRGFIRIEPRTTGSARRSSCPGPAQPRTLTPL
jgi:hypothetical protein